VRLERGALSLVNTTEEPIERKKTENTAVGIRRADHVALTSATSGGRSVGIIRSRNKATGFNLVFLFSFSCPGLDYSQEGLINVHS
jgi:hypothetical protein